MLKPRSAAMGETRAAASRVPKMRAKIPETTARKRVLRKPSQYWGRLSMMTSIGSFSCVEGVQALTGQWRPPDRTSRTPATATPCLVAVDGGELRGRLDDSACSCFPGLLVRAVLVEGFQLVVDPVAEDLVVLLQADGVRLLVDEAGQDDVVGGDRFDLLVAQRLKAGGVGRGRDQDCSVLLHDRGGRGGTGHGADVLALDVFGLGDGVVVLVHHEGLACLVVRAGEVDFGLALVVDRVGGDDDVDLALLDELLAVGRNSLDTLDLVGGDDQLGGDQLTDLDVEADRLAVEALLAEQRLVKLGADGDLAGGRKLCHGAVGGEARLLGYGRIGSGGAAAAS